ncbi:MAG TPA: DUF262 domain-containing protein [Chitinophagales bacterium]|nr:DUF262 domain-containing protein [Chitinophagales bacterium]
MDKKKINIREYFNNKIFIVPAYQRGYKWSVKDKEKESSLDFFIDSFIKAFESGLKEYFIEAVTVVEGNGEIILVDGQQRTTSLFLIFVTLGDFEFIKSKLKYDVRKDSRKWLNNLISDTKEEIEDSDTQDIFYFEKALKLINDKLENIDKDDFLNFIKEQVFLLYNPIPKEKAVNTFIALNGLKAIMKDEELIKSDLLIKSSRIEDNELDKEQQFGIEWKINEDRGRLARNWDKWLYWWNRKEIKDYFGTGKHHPLYYLLITYWKINHSENGKIKNFSFDNFKSKFISNAQNAKLHFEGLRKLQKTFEDLYNDFDTYNFLGLILKTSNSREDALHYFLDSNIKREIAIKDYTKWSLVGSTHLEIIDNVKINDKENKEIIIKIKKAQDNIGLINEKYVYWDENDNEYNDGRKEYAFRFLLLLNLLEDNKLGRKFDFSIWNNRSLEHIFPKLKSNDLKFNNKNYNEGSIHCIGNLVLLYGNDNSSFGAKNFSDKKNTYFDTSEEFKSRNLLHTISVFSKSQWREREIIDNKKSIINQLNNYYGLK